MDSLEDGDVLLRVKTKNNPELGAPFITAEQFKHVKQAQPSTLMEVMKYAKAAQVATSKIDFLDANELDPHHLTISYNNLQVDRFVGISVYIQASPMLRNFSDQMQEIYDSRVEVLNVTGMVGIGKTYAILYEVIKSRWLNKSSVFYINNPKLLVENWTTYVIRELIYLLVYDLKNESVAKQVENFFSDEPGDDIYQKITFYFQKIIGLDCVENIRKFLFDLKKIYMGAKRAFVLFFDQKTSFDRMVVKKPEAKKWTDDILSSFDLIVYGMSTLEAPGTSTSRTIYLESKFDLNQTKVYLENRILEVTRKMLEIEFPKLSEDQKELTPENYESHGKFCALCDATDFVPLELEMLTRMLNALPMESEPAATFENVLKDFSAKRSSYFKDLNAR